MNYLTFSWLAAVFWLLVRILEFSFYKQLIKLILSDFILTSNIMSYHTEYLDTLTEEQHV